MNTVVDIFKKNDIKYFLHFTSVYNLKSILTNGLLSIKQMQEKSILYNNSDNNRFDNKLDYISISANEINKKMLFKKIMNNDNNKANIWVILIIDLSVLNDNTKDFLYCKDNASTSEIYNILQSNPNILKNDESLINFIESDNPQKEILVRNNIDVKYIKGIIVKEQNDIDIVKYILSGLNLDIPVICKKDKF